MNIVLVHGSWHGAWCWEKIGPLLAQAGHTVFVPDLPGHGQDKTSLQDITLASYVDCIMHYLKTCDSKVMLVGHSMAGMVISQVAEYMPEKISHLVYVAGFLPQNGESLMSIAKLQKPTKITAPINIVSEEQAIYFPANAMHPFAYHQMDAEKYESLKPLFCVEPFKPWIQPVKITSERFGTVPRTYIVCEDDKAIHLSSQERMLQHTPCQMFRLMTDHSPFYSEPEGLAEILLALV